jgi:hypothetical protein
VHDITANSLLAAINSLEKTSREQLAAQRNLERLSKEQIVLQRAILHHLNPAPRVIGGTFTQVPSGGIMLPIQPGNSPKFQVTPTFSGAPFALVGAQAAVATSDSVNAPAALDLTDDPTGATFVLNLTAGAVIGAGGEPIVVTWTYINTDGTVATVQGTVTEEGIVDDVTGGTFAQVA